MNVTDFRAWHQEFRTASDDLIQLHLDEATLEVASDVFGTFTEKAIRLKAAHSLAMTPFGRSQRLSEDDGTTVYLTEFNAIAKRCAVNMIVI